MLKLVVYWWMGNPGVDGFDSFHLQRMTVELATECTQQSLILNDQFVAS